MGMQLRMREDDAAIRRLFAAFFFRYVIYDTACRCRLPPAVRYAIFFCIIGCVHRRWRAMFVYAKGIDAVATAYTQTDRTDTQTEVEDTMRGNGMRYI